MNPIPENINKFEDSSKIFKQSYKGIENFLRRAAFNLGNSPSQTDVKIISCIPIDVTDLQNKIINLERQLQEAKNEGFMKNIPDHTPLINSTLPNNNTVLSCKCGEDKTINLDNDMASQYGSGSSKVRKYTGSFLFPSRSAIGLSDNKPLATTKKKAPKKSLETNGDGHHKNFFRRSKKKKPNMKKLDPKTQLLYYVHTENSPFNSFKEVSTHNMCKNYSKTNIENILSKAYLASVIQRYFDPERVVAQFSDTSHFTSPVCRDFPNGRFPYESDVCSCCHGQFQNVDNFMTKNQNFVIEPITTHRLNKNIYYDSNHYDIIPVKEKVINKEKLMKKERKVHLQCWPEEPRSKARYQVTVKKQIKVPTKLENQKRYNTAEKNDQLRSKSPKHVKKVTIDQGTGITDTSESCYIDYGEVYPKPIFNTSINSKVASTRPTYHQNAESLTIDIGANKLPITRSIQIDINSTENKTEETLNQIKSILQSVLMEVKTNPQINHVQLEKSKKDVEVQKEPSQSNIQTGSSLLHSFTYNNSYDNNPYISSYSRQIPSNFCYTNVPCQRMKCSQNFPLLIHPPGQRICGCFIKNSGHTAQIQTQAVTTATNTEIREEDDNTKETDKLIKEIYKSIALTMNVPKDTSNSEYDELKSTTIDSTHRSDPKSVKSTVVVMSSLQKNDKQIEVSMTPLSTITMHSEYNNSSAGTIFNLQKTVDPFAPYENQTNEMHMIPSNELHERKKANIASTISEHDSEDYSSDDDDDIIEENKDIKIQKEKKGLLRRMLRSVKLFNKKNQNKSKTNRDIQEADEEESESDSDDYQTIYSEKNNAKSPLRKQYYKPRTYKTYRPAQHRVRTNRRSPYMEQEYRRQWEENLIFQENRGRRYSSERPFSVQNTPQIPPYWQKYEARSAIVDNTPYGKTFSPVRNAVPKVEKRTSTINFPDKKGESKSKISWLKKHKFGVNCGEQWKKFILEN